jgi:hypothetical protein
MDTFKEKLPNTYDFQVGYFGNKGTASSSKRWIELDADLTSMYKHYEGCDTVTLFCDGKSKEPIPSNKRKHSAMD